MHKRLIKDNILNCNHCPYLEGDEAGKYCTNPDAMAEDVVLSAIVRRVLDPFEFPEWCPLEDRADGENAEAPANATEEFLARYAEYGKKIFDPKKSITELLEEMEAKDKEIALLNSNICDFEDIIDASQNQIAQMMLDNKTYRNSVKSILSNNKKLKDLKATEQPESPRKLDLD